MLDSLIRLAEPSPRSGLVTGEQIRLIAWQWPYVEGKEDYLRARYDAQIKYFTTLMQVFFTASITATIGVAFALARGDIRRDLGWYATVPMLATGAIILLTAGFALYAGVRGYELQSELGKALTMYNAYLRIALHP